MAQNIGLTITLNGVDLAVKSIQDLEAAIGLAKKELNDLEIGSTQFNNLSKDINVAEGKLKDLKKASEGIDLDRKLGDFAKVGGAVTASFAAAQAAVNLFGGDAEKVGQAAAQAQNLLTIALTARSVAEGIVGLRTVKTTIATVAQTVATNASSVAMRAFFAVVAANPLGALLTVIGLVVGAIIALTGETKEAESAEEQYQRTLKKTNDEREFTLTLLREQGATDEQLSRLKIANAQKDLNAARARVLVLTQEGAAQETLNKEFEIIAASKKTITLEQARLDRLSREETAEGEKELAEQRKKRNDDAKQIQKDELERQKELIRTSEELRRVELLRLSTGQQFKELNLSLEAEKQNAEFIRLKNTVGETDDLLKKYSETFQSGVKRDEIILKSLGSTWESVQAQLQQDVTLGILKPEDIARIEDERKKVETNIKLISTALIAAKTDIEQSDLARVIREQLDIEAGVGKTFEELQKTRLDFAALETKFVKDFVNANLDRTKSLELQKVQEEELTKTGQEYFKSLVDNQRQVLLYDQSLNKLTERFNLAQKANEQLVTSGQAINGFIRENTKLIAENLTVDIQALSLNQQGIIALEKAILGERKDLYGMFAYDVEQIEKELAKKGIDITKASEEEKLRILYEYIQRRQNELGSELGNFTKNLEKAVQDVSGVLNAIAQTTAQSFSLQFELLELQYQASLEKIVGDTDEANNKRLEAEKIYQGQVKQLQKEQAKFNLQLTLYQAIANSAAAIVEVTKQTGIFSVIAAGIVAVANLAQIQNITKQINAINSLKRGGFIKGQGGMVVGPSHEYGGVKYQNGGVELEGGESVINRVSSVRYNDLLSQVNMAGGGKPLMVNNFDDSRIVEAIAKQRKEPIRAYVLEQDITQKQAINRRLEQLAQI
jgi:hypothetical protein